MSVTTCPANDEIRELAAAARWPELAARLAGVEPAQVESAAIAVAGCRAFTAGGDDALAEAWLDRAAALGADVTPLLRGMSLALQRKGDWPRALEFALRALSHRPDDAAYRAAVALAHYRLGRHAEAATAFRAALELEPHRGEWWLNLARALANAGEPAQALAACRRAAELGQVDGATPLAERLETTLRKLSAEEAARARASSSPPDEEKALRQARAVELRNRSLALQKQAQWAASVEPAEEAAALRPDIAAYHASVAWAHYHLGQDERAVAAYRRAVALEPQASAWWARLGRCLARRGELPAAVEAYRRALDTGGDTAIRNALEELQRQVDNHSAIVSSSYYDAVYRDSAAYEAPAARSPYAPVWNRLAELLRGFGACRILDLGCGPGQFAEFVREALPEDDYCGVDFSAVAIDKARQRVPGFAFERLELPITDFAGRAPFDVVVCTEVLEHVEADLAIVAALPPGTPLLATVPDFDSFGHLRTFPDEASVRTRYGGLLDDLVVERHALSPKATLWIFQGRRRRDA